MNTTLTPHEGSTDAVSSVTPEPSHTELIPGLNELEHAAIVCLLGKPEGLQLNVDHLHALDSQVVTIRSESKLRHHLQDLRDDALREERITQLRQLAREAMTVVNDANSPTHPHRRSRSVGGGWTKVL